MTVKIETVKIVGVGKSGFPGFKQQKVRTERYFREVETFTEDLGNGILLEMVKIPAGNFLMGQTETEKEELIRRLGAESYADNFTTEIPQHEVAIESFWMGRYLVTQAQYQLIMGTNPSNFQGSTLPVEQVSWFEAVEFCEKVSQLTQRNYRLPSEAEWEYACRSGTSTPFCFGETLTSSLANYNGTYAYGKGLKGEYRETTTKVGTFVANAFGIYDSHGNVWEWCGDDWHDNFTNKPDALKTRGNSIWKSQEHNSLRAIRGGSWASIPWDCRSAIRRSGEASSQFHILGFRVAC